jgi:hypothetical protein
MKEGWEKQCYESELRYLDLVNKYNKKVRELEDDKGKMRNMIRSQGLTLRKLYKQLEEKRCVTNGA